MFLEEVEPLSWNELVSIPLWYNPSIKVEGNAVFYRSWKNKCILLINGLLDSNGELLTYPEFQRKFLLPFNFLVFEGITRSIKNYIFSFRWTPFLYTQENPILTYSLLHIFKYRYIYDKLIASNVKPKSVVKWQTELNLPE